MKLKPLIVGGLFPLVTGTPMWAFDPIISMGGEHLTIHPSGATDEILATRDQTDGRFGIVTLSSNGNDGPGPAIVHANSAEIWYVLEGTYEFHVEDRVFEGGPGTFVAVDAGQSHGFVGKTPGKLLVIFMPGGYEQFFMDWDRLGLEPGPELVELEESYGLTRP
jgi:mannose-6-phosphate isomerase-like protein (cupin superfamily)